MRKLAFLLAFVATSLFAAAQSTSFKPFKVDLAFGYAIPSGEGAKGGIVAALEPKYSINDNITLGLRMEAAVTARAAWDEATQTFKSGSVKASGSYLATADYFFNTNTFRPFAGIGTGIYTLAAAEVDDAGNSAAIEAANKFGFAPRAGFEVGHFRMAAEYNFAGKTGEINNNYLSVKIGFFIGGGRAK